MPRYIALILVGLIYAGSTATPVVAAKIGGGGSGLNFSCDTELNQCKCDGVWEGTDCQAMKWNCKNTKPDCGMDKGSKKGKKGCSCQMKPTILKLKVAPGGMKLQTPTKDKPKKSWPSTTGTMKTVPMKQYKMAPMKQKSN